MRTLALLALAALAVLPLSAHDAWHAPRRLGVEGPHRAPHYCWEARHHDVPREHRGWCRQPGRKGCTDMTLLRPLPRPPCPPFGHRGELRFH